MVRNPRLKELNKSVSVFEKPPELGASKTTFAVSRSIFNQEEIEISNSGKKKSQSGRPFLIVGFDTEFKTPEYHVSREDIVSGNAKYKVLSYQFHAKLQDGREWQGICCMDKEDRLSINDFIIFVLGKGVKDYNIKDLPLVIYLVGHFTRADIPAFADFKTQTQYLSSVRSTFLSIDQSLPVELEVNGELIANLQVLIRDTMLLTPQASKSLKSVGELVGFPKLQLDPNPLKHKEMLKSMDRVRVSNWDLYKQYALMDATICVQYIERIISQYEAVTGKKKVPVTLTSIGLDLLLKNWTEELQIDALEVVGKEEIKEKRFNKKRNHFFNKKVKVEIQEFSHYINSITECYHGGRNEQYWFGPAFEDDWIDLDLASAYPTAMSLIGLPDWRAIKDSKRLEDYTPTTLGFAWVDFEFPPTVRFPTMPVRLNGSIVFPLKGSANCAAPEIFLATQLGCKIKIRKGCIIPTNPSLKIFTTFIKQCIERRQKAGSKTLEGLFWKEISNSTYGKTAQGLNKKRIYDMRDQDTKPLPPSPITNPAFAAFITSFVRAVLGEIINSIDNKYEVFSCTTDGFITNLPRSKVKSISSGPFAMIYAEARNELAGNSEILEVKHEIRLPLGWRTRGQATLVQHERLLDKEEGIVLAKGGIFTKPESESDHQQNDEIIDLFFNRQPTSHILIETLTGIRDIVEHDADLVSREISKRLSMEYDWKRQPVNVSKSVEYDHVYFASRPWESINQFGSVRELWDEYTKSSPKCIKTIEDFDDFADFIECRALAPDKSKYLRKKNPDVHRLRQMLCEAWHQSKAGLSKSKDMTANQFASILVNIGIPCKRTDVENGKKKSFEPNSCPPTKLVISLLKELKKSFPKVQPSKFLMTGNSRNSVTIRTN